MSPSLLLCLSSTRTVPTQPRVPRTTLPRPRDGGWASPLQQGDNSSLSEQCYVFSFNPDLNTQVRALFTSPVPILFCKYTFNYFTEERLVLMAAAS